ncbi:MAG: hypothetical protein NT157_00665, partial [Candidatus Micrarchaeota archaeon]|nr:hypothetical protein [Candidatus Micrarchaeota archaeon]
FKKEFKKIEFRRLPDAFELHDRYIVADNALVIVGQGLKDLGKKESFVVYLPLELTCSFIPTLRKVFEERWKRSQKV